ncbi:MAG TPA: dienelactone hydrolase family protein [Paenalcaligenes sp.]|nr:dienelactone hydrolase family protein [Paenalcaligenes sp.]
MSELLECIEINPQKEARYAIIWLHGLGADGNDFVPIVPELGLDDLNIRFVFPHAPVQPVTVNAGMPMRSWYDIYVADLVRREDAKGLRESQAQVEALISREIDQGIPSERIVLAGFSQGCAMTLQTGLRWSERLAGLVCLSGYLPLADVVDKERNPANQDTPIFMAHGTQDPVVPLQRGENSRKQLEKMGYDVEWHTYPMPHSVHPHEIRDIATFLRKILTAQQ